MRHLEKTKQNDVRKKFIQITNSFWNKRFRVQPPIAKTFCELPQEIIDKEVLISSINNIIEYTSRRFMIYRIPIYGLLNFKTVRLEVTDKFVHFEFTMKHLTAKISSIRYMGGLVFQVPEVIAVTSAISEILLTGKIDQNTGVLEFTNSSLPATSDYGEMDNFKPIVLESIQRAVKEKFNTMRCKMYYFT